MYLNKKCLLTGETDFLIKFYSRKFFKDNGKFTTIPDQDRS